MRRISLSSMILLAAIVATPRGNIAHAQAPADRSAQRDLDQLGATLEGTEPAEKKDEAARRLVSRDTPEARAILNSVLDSAERSGQLAVARALAADPTPNAQFIAPLQKLLSNDPQLTEAAAQALAQFKDNSAVFRGLDDFAKSTRNARVRVPVIRVLGTMYDRRAVASLIEFIGNNMETPAIRDAAAEALGDLTGLRENGRDVQMWQKWWEQNRNKPEDQFRMELLKNRAERFEAMKAAHAALFQATRQFLENTYQAQPEEKKPEFLLQVLRAQQSEFRSIGAQLVRTDMENSREPSDSVKVRLREMIGDSDSGVRQEVARTLYRINDKESFEPLLAQFGQERDPEVKRAMAGPLAFSAKAQNDLRAVTLLVTLLDDSSFATQAEGARALADLSPVVRDKDPAQARALADKLVRTYEAAANKAGSEAVRVGCLKALGPLKDSRLLKFFSDQLKDPNPAIKEECLRAMGEIGEPQAANQIANHLGDADAGVRRAAVDALGTTATFAHAEKLFTRLGVEPDAQIRDRIWHVLSQLFDQAPAEQLPAWADRFQKEPSRRLTVQEALAKKLMKDKSLEQLAYTHQDMGQTHMRLGDPDRAATYFAMALRYWEDTGAANAIMEPIVRDRMDSLLKSRQYAEATQFAAKMIEKSTTYQQIMGPKIRKEIEDLKDKGDLKNCETLINETQKMEPPLAENFLGPIRSVRDELNRRK